MNSLFLGIITICLFAITIFFIGLLIEIRMTMKSLKDLILITEKNLIPPIADIQVTLKSIQQLTENINKISEDAKVFFSCLRNIGEDLQHMSNMFNQLSTSGVNKINDIFSSFKNIIGGITKFCPSWGRKEEGTYHG